MVRLFRMLKGELMVLQFFWLRSLLPVVWGLFSDIWSKLALTTVWWQWSNWTAFGHQLDINWTITGSHRAWTNSKLQKWMCTSAIHRMCPSQYTSARRDVVWKSRYLREIFESYAGSSVKCNVNLSLCTSWNRFWIDLQLPGAWRAIHYWSNWKRLVSKQICRFSHQIQKCSHPSIIFSYSYSSHPWLALYIWHCTCIVSSSFCVLAEAFKLIGLTTIRIQLNASKFVQTLSDIRKFVQNFIEMLSIW